MTDKHKTCSVTALTDHTNHGHAYAVGDTYDVPETEVESLVAQGMAVPSEHAEPHAKVQKSKK